MGLLKLKRGVVLHFKNDVYTRVNMTDAIAAEALKENPKRADFFEELPDNWEELIKEDLSDKSEGEDSAEQIAAEKALIIEIAKLLLDKTTKTAIREKYTGLKVGKKDIKTRDITAFIKEADEVLKNPEKLKELQESEDDDEVNLDELDRKGLEDFINLNELTIEFDESTSDEDLRTLIVDAIDKDEE